MIIGRSSNPGSAGVPPAGVSKPQRSAGVSPAGAPEPHKYWHSRGYLPHCDTPGLVQSITFRLADALPAEVLKKLLDDEPASTAQQEHLAQLLDSGMGSCLLLEPAIGQLVEDALLHFDGQRYQLLAWCVMPNHVHVVLETRGGYSLSHVVQAWKSFTVHAINRLKVSEGMVWQADYFDRYVRSDEQLQVLIAYVEQNPVTAGLVVDAAAWPFSSARRRQSP